MRYYLSFNENVRNVLSHWDLDAQGPQTLRGGYCIRGLITTYAPVFVTGEVAYALLSPAWLMFKMLPAFASWSRIKGRILGCVMRKEKKIKVFDLYGCQQRYTGLMANMMLVTMLGPFIPVIAIMSPIAIILQLWAENKASAAVSPEVRWAHLSICQRLLSCTLCKIIMVVCTTLPSFIAGSLAMWDYGFSWASLIFYWMLSGAAPVMGLIIAVYPEFAPKFKHHGGVEQHDPHKQGCNHHDPAQIQFGANPVFKSDPKRPSDASPPPELELLSPKASKQQPLEPWFAVMDSHLDEQLPDGVDGASLHTAGIELEHHGISIFDPDENEKRAKKLKKAKKAKKVKKDQQDRQGLGNSNKGVLDLDSYMSSVGPSKRQAQMTRMATNADGVEVLISKGTPKPMLITI